MQVTQLSNTIPNESDAKTAGEQDDFKDLHGIKLPTDKDTRRLHSWRRLQDLVHQASCVMQVTLYSSKPACRFPEVKGRRGLHS